MRTAATAAPSACRHLDASLRTWEAVEIQPWIEAITGMVQVDDYAGYSPHRADESRFGESVVESGSATSAYTFSF
jgi:hypothetical protein